jgi:serine protease
MLRSGADPVRLAAFVRAITGHLPYVPGELLVRFKGSVEPVRQQLALRVLRFDPARTRSRWIGPTLLVTGVLESDMVHAATVMAAQPEVVYAQPNYFRHSQAIPNDPGYNLQWNMDQVNMPAAWDINPGMGRGVTVAVLDSGLTTFNGTYQLRLPNPPNGSTFGSYPVTFLQPPDHDSSRILPGAEFTPTGPWFLATTGAQVIFDTDSHGTHVTGTLAEQTNNGYGFAGVASGVSVMPVKVCLTFVDFVMAWGRDLRPGVLEEGCGTDDALAAGIRYAVEHGAKVLNMSLGGPQPDPAVQEALQYAVSQGAFVAISAGNCALGDQPACPGIINPPMYPAVYAASIEGVVAVGATTRSRTRALYSSSGSYVELAAPGGEYGCGFSEGVWQVAPDAHSLNLFPPQFNQYVALRDCGTSMASPHVAGAAALLYSQGITDPASIEAALESSAVDLGTPGRDPEFGYGLLDVRAALFGLGVQ